MEILRTILFLFGGKVGFINIFCLILFFTTIATFIKNKKIRLLLSFIFSFVVLLELTSLYFTKSFVGYKFYIHFNIRDIIGLYQLYILQSILAFVVFLFLLFFFFWSRTLLEKMRQTFSKIFPIIHNVLYKPYNYLIGACVIVFSIFIMSIKNGIINETSDLFVLLNVSEQNFEESLKNIGMHDYIYPSEVKAEGGKNIIIISLESYESGYLSDTKSHLTPNLIALKNKWNYINMQQNMGGEWTSGALYTCLTGLPAIFGINGNYIFQSTYRSHITGIGHVLKKAGYELTYLVKDADYSGTKPMLEVLQFDNFYDEKIIGTKLRDKDIFEQAKKVMQQNIEKDEPFMLFISTTDTHFPDGIYDERMEQFVKAQNSNMEFMVAAVDYMIGDFISFLEDNSMLSNTIIYIMPDHLKMGSSEIFKNTGQRGLYVITNSNDLSFSKSDTILQIDLPNLILDGANIRHNAKFLTDYIPQNIDKHKFISDNIEKLTALNISGLLRFDTVPEVPISKSANYNIYINDTSRFIAHAGGKIDGNLYTNSLEALDLNYQKGFRLFELDILKTSDGIYVAAHDWEYWAKITNYSGSLPVTHDEFMKHKIYDKYTPLDISLINEWFTKHSDAILVTDKINEPKLFSECFYDKSKLMMELFTIEAVKEGIEVNIKSAMPSQNVIDKLEGDKLKILKDLGVKNIAVSRGYFFKNINFFKMLKENDIRVFLYNIYSLGVDENFVVKFEMDNFYGIYADEWFFEL